MKGTDLTGARLVGAQLVSVDLQDSNLKGAQFRGINPQAQSFEDIDELPDVEAELVNIDLRNAKYDSKTVWPESFDPEASGAIFEE